jgi:hypothetical protein
MPKYSIQQCKTLIATIYQSILLVTILFVYVPRSTNMIEETHTGGINPKNIRGVEWLRSKLTWEMMSIILGFVRDILDSLTRMAIQQG